MNNLPSTQDCYYILEMLESSLIDYRQTQPWADKIITDIDIPPSWLCDISLKKYQGDQVSAIIEAINNQPFEERPDNLDKFHVACLWLRYEKRELSWASLLDLIGDYLDAKEGEWGCETPYHYLNVYEESNFSEKVEEMTKKKYLEEHNVSPWIDLAKEKFKWFQ